MKQQLAVTVFSAVLLAFATAGCQRHETPEKTQADVMNAQAEGEKDAAETRHDVAEQTMDAQKDVSQANAELAHEAAQGRKAITVAEAETAHKVYLEKCETMSGDARAACKKQADLEYEQAKLLADTHAQVEDPKR